jgi:hypothetical protein
MLSAKRRLIAGLLAMAIVPAAQAQQGPQGFEGIQGFDTPPAETAEQPATQETAPAEGTETPQPAAPLQRIKNPIAEFSGIDKITGRIISFDVYIDETVQFGALQVTPRVCYASAENQEPKTDSFVEVDEITLDRKIRRIFTGWMFAESPGLNAVEHAVYDVWLKACKKTSDVPAPETATTN